MVYSMTGYGQSVRSSGGYKITIEAKSVNHRYCEIMLRMPREWTSCEEPLRRLVQQFVKRGRVDVFINREREGEAKTAVAINEQTVKAYMEAGRLLRDQYGVSGEMTVNDWLRLPDVFTIQEEQPLPEEELLRELESGLAEAMDGLCQMRVMEGNHLAQDMKERLNRLESLHADISTRAPFVVAEYRAKLQQRIEQLLDAESSLDEYKFGMEVALFADRSNIDEELTRLQSHFNQFRQLLDSTEPIGRKLDFLIQEMNREVNTIGSKANHLEIINHVVDMKAELEKIREQAANME
ncbi:YicC family protein [Paenibacillus thiaminolyticus]|uniref:YicC family protein n=1 Tax=Paenibacillus thiaminolyticus TaxID=49283 RepID=A0AAP9DY83_PANTH|nr:YicC/YloC family endoribonuclease [Paenibacillus thiaminolyticus]MCY9534468.1 YicC family protein [Paenibacillus thiaminolyticus]MCY9601278.1 YicC family protein [Paenibacillus thiaminolyticus]MCY9606493.1 YicC family protein [Paenibacillus thiaminolyticus]MCY9614093.1 YicC family protein [Paenibacillus thiaminolyticus]MCY9618630.1 YicC family protein [Paenibacillus thiaminolyticus]